MKKLVVAILAGALGACAGGGMVKEPARYDIGSPGVVAVVQAVPIATIEVESASWLAGTAMQYRLSYAEALRRQAYAESRWVAPPGELLGGFLRRQLTAAPASGGCRLRIALDEFEQRFDKPQSSELVIELRASLSPMRGSDILARRAFRSVKAAGSSDARGGAEAAQAAAQSLAADLATWAGELARGNPGLADRCRA